MKKILFDTSTLVAALVEYHPKQNSLYLGCNKKGIDKGVVSAHNILTIFPAKPRRISPEETQQLIQQNILNVFEVIALSEQDYMSVINHLSESGIIGGVIYDALILKAAIKANVDYVVTLNEKDFKRVYPDFADKIISP
ncbi:MAG: VapC toxin family PIN domain ribonuclease [Candidatus Parabeggiatoa sp. nov. 1]|nr:MAG: VapC toxin family PIN domain ribonuclease [Gammaproteobacteria bacterium]